jgi:hypothetical protein
MVLHGARDLVDEFAHRFDLIDVHGDRGGAVGGNHGIGQIPDEIRLERTARPPSGPGADPDRSGS